MWRAINQERAGEISRKSNAKYRATRHADYLASTNKCNDKVRDEVFAFYGEQCIRCGFADRRALQLDHVNGRAKGEPKHLQLFEKVRLIRSEPGLAMEMFQVLCANCNSIKRVENQEYRNGR